MKGLITLPYEVLSSIISDVDFDDFVSLWKTCKAFEFLRTDESMCRSILQLTDKDSRQRFSSEARLATTAGSGYAAALRRAAKRRDALATASPFTVAIIAVGDAYLYCKGVLCYTLDERVRVLDLHKSGQCETVISVPRLLARALPDIEDSRGHFRILYYSDNIISCLFNPSGSTPWLIACSITTKKVLVADQLASIEKIFVRHNRRYLYYGTHSEIGIDGYKKWVIHGIDFESRKWFPQKIHLSDIVGSEIGSTICFEFYKDHFYALSNQTSFEVEEIDWTSFYHCRRFPLNSPCKELLEKTENTSMWRRQHQEGPIDDRWTSLRLDEDETTGELKIVEARKEWYLGNSKSQITHYKTDIIFPIKDKELELAYSQPLPASSASLSALSSTSSLASVSTSSTAGIFTSASHDLLSLPNDPIVRLLRPDDNPHHMRPPPRLPQNTHPGNDGSHKPTFTLTKSPIRYYHTSASTYLTLVNDPDPNDWKATQRLRLRAGSRKLGPPLMSQSGSDQGLLRTPYGDLRTALKEMYREQPIAYWPPVQDPDHTDENLNTIYRLLNPPSHLDNVQGTADERSLVYATGDKPQAIVFVGFDPAIKLVGLKRWGGLRREGVDNGPHIDELPTEYVNSRDAQYSSVVQDSDDAKIGVDTTLESKQGMIVQLESWGWNEKAMYRDIARGCSFGLPPKRG